MKIPYKVEFFTDWHCGSGLAAGADVDALVVKDRDGLPFIPGKTVKGLLREALEDIVRFRYSANEDMYRKYMSWIRKYFGYFDGKPSSDGSRSEMTKGTAFFANAELPEPVGKAIVSDNLQSYLYRTLASTAIDEHGIAKDHSLRRIEVTVPCTLEGYILSNHEDKDMVDLVKDGLKFIKDGLKYIRRLGQNRNRGLGRCLFSVIDKKEQEEERQNRNHEGIKTLKFKCTLLSDVILNAKAATTGPNETLDFIPGSNFLGIVASQLYPLDQTAEKSSEASKKQESRLSKEEASLVFHSGKVRFGDAHPSRDGIRGLKVPASLFYPKLSSPENELYVHHLIPENADMGTKQLKQCRKGFYAFSSGEQTYKKGRLIKTSTSFALKSAYDRQQRRTKDEQLFGYQSLDKGITMYFSVEFDNDIESNIIGKVEDALVKGNRIGRSRSAQYGLVRIESVGDKEFIEIEGEKQDGGKSGAEVSVYADSRLIFLDEYGMPTFRPSPTQLGLEGGKVDWEKSQIRTFRYAPWNFQRQCFDTDRCGIEKGSVFVVSIPKGYKSDFEAQYVGSYRNEGFGRVIYNPPFLSADADGNAVYRLISDDENPKAATKTKVVDTPLIKYLRERKKEEDGRDIVFEKVNAWVKKNKKAFQKGTYASQWGRIRSLATSASSLENLHTSLFEEPIGYIMHGIAKDKWEGEKVEVLKDFVKELMVDRKLTDAMARLAVVNLASEMGKM